MAHFEKRRITLTTDAGGAASGFFPVCNGRIDSLQFVDVEDLTEGFTCTLSVESTGEAILAGAIANSKVRPSVSINGPDGAADPAAKTTVGLCEDRAAISIADGGNAVSCVVELTVEGAFRG